MVLAERGKVSGPPQKLLPAPRLAEELFALGIDAMRHGKDYMSDKPGMTSLQQLAEVRRVQTETKRIYSICYSEHFETRSTVKAGELVASQGLADPSQAKTVRFQNGAPVPTDGPFAEVKESLAGYWVVEVSEARAIEIASRVVAFIEYPMEVRQVMNESPEM